MPRYTRLAKKKLLRFEPLESRQMLSGVVNVQIFPVVAPGTMNFVGDGSNNEIEVRQTANPGEYHIQGESDTLLQINGAGVTMSNATVNGITGNITVNLGEGDDTFSFLGVAAGGVSNVPIDLGILNSGGSNTNVIDDLLINGDFLVNKAPATTGYSVLQIADTTIIGDTLVNNVGAGVGDTSTTISNSHLQGGGVAGIAFRLMNGQGKDIIQVQENSQFGTGGFIPAVPIVVIQNDGGASRTSFTGTTAVAGPGTTTVYGDVVIQNGVNLPGTLDIVSFNSVNVLGDVTVLNGPGNTQTTVTNSTLGSHLIPAVLGGPMRIINDAGYDTLGISDSTLPWGLWVNNDQAAGNTSTWGSRTDITSSSIGTSPFGPALPNPLDAMQLMGDNGADVVNVNGTALGGVLNLTVLGNGNNEVNVTNGSSMAGFNLIGGSGNETVMIDNSTITVGVRILLNAGADTLEVRNMLLTQWPDPLLGLVIIDGGLGTDTTNIGPFTLGALNFEFFVP